MRILVLEDELVSGLFIKILNGNGHSATQAISRENVSRFQESNAFDLIVIGSQQGQNLDLAEKLHNANQPVLVLSSFALPKGFSLPFLQKPFNQKQFVEKINSFLPH